MLRSAAYAVLAGFGVVAVMTAVSWSVWSAPKIPPRVAGQPQPPCA